MKKLPLLTAVALLAMLCTTALATYTMPSGEYRMSATDNSNLFSDTDGDGELEPEGLASSVDVGDEQRTVFAIDAINNGTKTVNQGTGVKFVQRTNGSPPYDTDLLSGMTYDLEVADIVPLDGQDDPGDSLDSNEAQVGSYDLIKTRAGRYLSGGGSTGTWTDAAPTPSDDYTASDVDANGISYGGLLVIYEDSDLNPDFAGNGDGPADWVEGGGGPISGPAGTALNDSDQFPTISDGEPWLVGVFADIHDIPAQDGYDANPWGVPDGTYLLEANYGIDQRTQTIDGSGIGFVNIIGGSAASAMDWAYDNFTIGDWRADMRVDFDLSGSINDLSADGWQVTSDDPLQVGVTSLIPEPATMSLLGLALVGLVGLRRRKRDL